MKNWILFCDGACLGNPGPGGWGAIVLSPTNDVQEYGGHKAHTTNNQMELSAFLLALEKIPNGQIVEVYTDSKYLIEGVTKWINGWIKKDWTTASGTPVQNQELWKRIKEIRSGYTLKFTHVRGHAGIPGNERCDEIASSFADAQLKNQLKNQSSKSEVKLYRGSLEAYPVRLMDTKTFSPFYLSFVSGKLQKSKTWPECQALVKGKSGAKFKKITSHSQEIETLEAWGLS